MNKKDKLLIGALALVVVAAFIGGQMWNKHKTFTTELWVNYEGNSRQAIVNNFLDRTIVNGMTEEELIAYLGEPEERGEDKIAYYLGKPRSLFGKSDAEEQYLLLTFADGVADGFQIIGASALSME